MLFVLIFSHMKNDFRQLRVVNSIAATIKSVINYQKIRMFANVLITRLTAVSGYYLPALINLNS